MAVKLDKTMWSRSSNGAAHFADNRLLYVLETNGSLARSVNLGSETLVEGFSDEALSVSLGTGPFTSNADGQFDVWFPLGSYDLYAPGDITRSLTRWQPIAGAVPAEVASLSAQVTAFDTRMDALEGGRPLCAHDFGLLPGATAAANATALATAIAAADAQGRALYIPAGIYSYNNPVAANNAGNVTIYGDGGQASLLVPTSNGTQFLTFANASRVTMMGVAIGPTIHYGSRNTATSIEFTDGANIRVEKCDIFHSPSIAVAFVRCDNAVAFDNDVNECRADGIHFLDCVRLTCTANRINATEDDSIAVNISSDAYASAMLGGSVSLNIIDGNSTGNGVRLSSAVGVSVLANNIRNTISAGIRVGKTAGFGTATKGCKQVKVIGNLVVDPFPVVASIIAGIEVASLDGGGTPILDASRVNEDITVTGNTVINSGNQSYEFSSVLGGVFANNTGINANNNNGAYSTCAAVRNCTAVTIGSNVMQDTRGTPLSVAGFYLADLTDCILAAQPVLRGMTNPKVVWAGTNTNTAGQPPIAPTLTNSWVNYAAGYDTAGYTKDAKGYVHVSGTIKNGTIGATAFTLPAGYRPAANKIYATVTDVGLGGVTIFSTGEVVPVTGSNVLFGLDLPPFRGA